VVSLTVSELRTGKWAFGRIRPRGTVQGSCRSGETVAKDFAVARWQKEAGSTEFRRRSDQSHQIAVGLRDAVAEKASPVV
jgi:hypothetical protein